MIAVRVTDELPLVVAGSPAYFAQRGKPKTPDDLVAHDCIRIRFSSGTYLPWRFRVKRRDLEVHVEGRLVVNSVTVARRAAIEGLALVQGAAHLHRIGSRRGQACDRSRRMGANSGDRIFSLLSEPPPDAAGAQGVGGFSAQGAPRRIAVCPSLTVERQMRAVKEFLSALEAVADPNPDRKPPKVISPSDPCSAWTAKANKRVQFGYGLNYLIDIENAVIVDVEPTPARTYDEVESTKTMLDRTERRFNLKPKRLAADTAYGTGRFLGWLVGRGIAPHIPVRDASERDDGTFSRSDFRWDKRRGVYICPNNKVLHTTGTVHEGNMLRYRASKFDCDVCALKMQCCPNMPARQVPRDIHEDARDLARRLMRTKALPQITRRTKRVEMRFAHLKISPRLRTHAAPRSFRRARRIPPRRDRAEPQDASTPSPRPPNVLRAPIRAITSLARRIIAKASTDRRLN